VSPEKKTFDKGKGKFRSTSPIRIGRGGSKRIDCTGGGEKKKMTQNSRKGKTKGAGAKQEKGSS